MKPFPGSQSSEERWHQNEAHGGLYGVYMNKDGLPGCSLIRGFTVWKSYDYGIYFQVGGTAAPSAGRVGWWWWCTCVEFSLYLFSFSINQSMFKCVLYFVIYLNNI